MLKTLGDAHGPCAVDNEAAGVAARLGPRALRPHLSARPSPRLSAPRAPGPWLGAPGPDPGTRAAQRTGGRAPGPTSPQPERAPLRASLARAQGSMYLLDGGGGEPAPPPEDSMPRGTPPRKTVYRISVTMVRKEQLATPGSDELELRSARRPRPARSPDAPEQLLEEPEEDAEGGSPRSWDVRTFRTRSTGQLELGRLRPCARGPDPVDVAGSPPVLEGRSSLAPDSPGAEGPRAQTLRRSLSFRHWSAPEAPQGPVLDSGRRRSSSGSLAWAPDEEPETGPEAAATALQPSSEKRNTLDVGEVLSKNDALSDLERWERSKSKNRTLDNSDLQRLERARAAASEHRLLRFFSGIFARRDGAPSLRSGAPRTRGYFSSLRRAPVDAHSSSAESIDGSPRRGGLWGEAGGRGAVA